MQEMMIFNNAEFGQVRSVIIDNEPWFVGKDVAEALGYKNTKDAILSHVDKDDRRIIQRSDIPTIENHIPKEVLPVDFVRGEIPNRGLSAINESGLYALIFGSKLESARKFKHWVTSEVLPSLRKTGSYNMVQPEERAEIKVLRERTQHIRELNALIDRCKGDIRAVERLLIPEPNNLSHVPEKSVRTLETDEIESVENYVLSHQIEVGDYVKDIYDRYVEYCHERGWTPRTRQAFTLRVKDIKNLTGMTKTINGRSVRIFKKFK